MQYRDHFKTVIQDRPYLFLMIAIAFVALVGSIYVLATVEPRDIQVATQYTSFGETNYYKGRWYSLYGYALLFITIAISHAALMVKFHALERRDFGVLFGAGTIMVLIVGTIYAANVIQQIAFI
jgi:hypothetical protein